MIHRPGLAVGDQFRELYANAAAAYPPDTLLHLCFVDRFAFILQSEHSRPFIDDMLVARYDESPLIFHRSEAAWATHPANYRAAEQMVDHSRATAVRPYPGFRVVPSRHAGQRAGQRSSPAPGDPT